MNSIRINYILVVIMIAVNLLLFFKFMQNRNKPRFYLWIGFILVFCILCLVLPDRFRGVQNLFPQAQSTSESEETVNLDNAVDTHESAATDNTANTNEPAVTDNAANTNESAVIANETDTDTSESTATTENFVLSDAGAVSYYGNSFGIAIDFADAALGTMFWNAYRTNNGGRSWELAASSIRTGGREIRNLTIVNKNLMSCQFSSLSIESKDIIFSSDGGFTWTELTMPEKYTKYNKSVIWANESQLMLKLTDNKNKIYGGLTFISKDSGENWTYTSYCKYYNTKEANSGYAIKDTHSKVQIAQLIESDDVDNAWKKYLSDMVISNEWIGMANSENRLVAFFGRDKDVKEQGMAVAVLMNTEMTKILEIAKVPTPDLNGAIHGITVQGAKDSVISVKDKKGKESLFNWYNGFGDYGIWYFEK